MIPGAAHEYSVPTYRAAAGSTWYHFLHGNVPGHQIDFMYRAEVPQGPLSPQHFSHLARLMKYIEPRGGGLPFAFAIGNLSRDDTQHEPGHGGLGLILGFRVKGATDHAGRRDPPFAHGIAAVDRHLDFASIFQASVAFCRRALGEPDEGDLRALAEMYGRYVAAGPGSRAEVIRGYLSSFKGLPRLARSGLSGRWVSRGAPPAKRVVITHADDAPFHELAWCAARVAAVLYQSNIRWTAITTGRESEIANGILVRLVPRREAGAPEADALVLPIEQVPEDEGEIAARLFGAEPCDAAAGAAVRGELFGSLGSSEAGEAVPAPPAASITPEMKLDGGVDSVDEEAVASGRHLDALSERGEVLFRSPGRRRWLALGALGGVGLLMLLMLRSASDAGEGNSRLEPAKTIPSPGAEGAAESAATRPDSEREAGKGAERNPGKGDGAAREVSAAERATSLEEGADRGSRRQSGAFSSGRQADSRDRDALPPRDSGGSSGPIGGLKPAWKP
jgi:hypothetical protein